MLVIEKRRFNRIDVSLGATIIAVDMNLNAVSNGPDALAHVVDLSPTGMLLITPQSLRAGARYRVTLKLPERSVQVYCKVKHLSDFDNGTQFKHGAGMQIVGATQDAVITVVQFLASIAKTQELLNVRDTEPRNLPTAA